MNIAITNFAFSINKLLSSSKFSKSYSFSVSFYNFYIDLFIIHGITYGDFLCTAD